MKKTLVTLAMILVGLTTQMFAMSMSNIRTNARFLSDRMAYELDLTPMQYDDCYEINFDFIYSINDLMDDVIYGYGDAIENYYRMLDYRNEDLRYVLNAHQYARFLALEYFYRPIYTTGRSWAFRIHSIYHNHSHFYFSAPSIYHSYRGAHSHLHYHNDYYVHRHHHEIHRSPAHIHGSPRYHDHGRSDFGDIRHERNDRHRNGIGDHRSPSQHSRPQEHSRPQAGQNRQQSGRPEGANRQDRGNRRNEARSQGSRREHGNNSGTRAGGNNGGGRRENGRNGHEGGGRGRR